MPGSYQRRSNVGAYQGVHITAIGSNVPVGLKVFTTSTTTVAPGVVTVTVAAWQTGIIVGRQLYVYGGTGTAEWIEVTSINSSANQFTATFANSHSGTWTLESSKGTYFGGLIVNQPGTGVQFTFSNGAAGGMNGVTVIGVLAIATTTPDKRYDTYCEHGLLYTVSGTMGDFTLLFLDDVP